ncbi:unnamed protein product [Ceratitis capitata]|uniref:(Mediterranean fruit fly) hypothetical protein n=1 Tax=Ceratitis capitata TaxID=7213 RepID=A0A811URG3_CERCA|nr:unnamed protein product [Ceratitis capitata]
MWNNRRARRLKCGFWLCRLVAAVVVSRQQPPATNNSRPIRPAGQPRGTSHHNYSLDHTARQPRAARHLNGVQRDERIRGLAGATKKSEFCAKYDTKHQAPKDISQATAKRVGGANIMRYTSKPAAFADLFYPRVVDDDNCNSKRDVQEQSLLSHTAITRRAHTPRQQHGTARHMTASERAYECGLPDVSHTRLQCARTMDGVPPLLVCTQRHKSTCFFRTLSQQ